jgi:hypothetical protein
MSATYWRVYVTANNGNDYLQLAEVQMRATVGGADQCTGGTASAINYFSSNVPGRAFDDDPNTHWLSEGDIHPGPDWWIQYQFGSAVDVAELVLKHWSGGVTSRMPKDFQLQYSNDLEAWTTAGSWTDQTGWTAGEERAFVVSAGFQAAWTVNANGLQR